MCARRRGGGGGGQGGAWAGVRVVRRGSGAPESVDEALGQGMLLGSETFMAKGNSGEVSWIASPAAAIHSPTSRSRSSATAGSSPVGMGPTSSSSDPCGAVPSKFGHNRVSCWYEIRVCLNSISIACGNTGTKSGEGAGCVWPRPARRTAHRAAAKEEPGLSCGTNEVPAIKRAVCALLLRSRAHGMARGRTPLATTVASVCRMVRVDLSARGTRRVARGQLSGYRSQPRLETRARGETCARRSGSEPGARRRAGGWHAHAQVSLTR